MAPSQKSKTLSACSRLLPCSPWRSPSRRTPSRPLKLPRRSPCRCHRRACRQGKLRWWPPQRPRRQARWTAPCRGRKASRRWAAAPYSHPLLVQGRTPSSTSSSKALCCCLRGRQAIRWTATCCRLLLQLQLQTLQSRPRSSATG